MCSDSLNFGPHNTYKNCAIFVQVAFPDMGDSSYHTQKQDADVEYLGRVRKAICSHVGSINVVDPANIRQLHCILIN